MKTVRIGALFREAGFLAGLWARVQMRVDISIQLHKSRLHKQGESRLGSYCIDKQRLSCIG